MWGGYSPKVGGGEFMKERKKWLSNHLAGAAIVDDCAFHCLINRVPNVNFVTPYLTPPKPRDKAKAKGFSKISKKNKSIIHKFGLLGRVWNIHFPGLKPTLVT